MSKPSKKGLVQLVVFETEEELKQLTGIENHDELWGVGFDLDDWDIGFQSNTKLHRDPSPEDLKEGYYSGELIVDWDLPAHWLMSQMENYCVGANYTYYNGKHYYTVHHS